MKKIYVAAAIAAMIFTGCTNVDIDEPDRIPEPESAMLGFESVVTANLETRADDGALTQDFKFNLAAATGGYEALNAQNVTYGSGFTVDNPVYIFKGITRSLTAWTPADVTFKAEATPNLFTLTPGVAAKDFVFATSMDVKTDNCTTLVLSMKRAMAKLTFKVKFPAGYTTPRVINSLTVKGTPGASDFDISTGAWSTPLGVTAPISVVTADFTAADDAAEVGTTLVVPQTAATLTVDCSVNGQVYPDVAISGITDVVMGTNYVITLTVSNNTMTFQSVTVEGWKTDAGSGELK